MCRPTFVFQSKNKKKWSAPSRYYERSWKIGKIGLENREKSARLILETSGNPELFTKKLDFVPTLTF